MPHRLHLLVVEDQRFDAMPLRRLLEAPEIGAVRLDRAGSLADAIGMLLAHFYDAALVDLELPDARGADVVRELCERFPNLAVVVLTGEESDGIDIEAMAAGAQDKLTGNRIDAATLAQALHHAVARQRLGMEQRQVFDDHRLLFQNHPYAWLVCDRHTLRIMEANQAALIQYGYARDELATRTLLDLSPFEERGMLLEILRSEDLSAPVLRNASQVTRDGRSLRAALTIQSTEQRRRPALIVLARDITAEEKAIRSLERSERRFRKLFQYSQGLICTHDMEGVLLSVNPAAAQALGYTAAELLGHRFIDFMPGRQHAAFAEYLRRIAAEREEVGVFRLIAADGRSHIWEYHNVIDEDDHGESYVLGHAQDITHRVLQERRLQEEALRDPLTGCFNRRAFDAIEQRLGDDNWGVAVIDLDGFKRINDTEGHARGDHVLAEMGRFLRRITTEQADVVRSGGDEFVVVARGPASDAESVLGHIESGRSAAPVAFTVGWAMRHGRERLADTTRRADEHLYAQRRRRGTPALARDELD